MQLPPPTINRECTGGNWTDWQSSCKISCWTRRSASQSSSRRFRHCKRLLSLPSKSTTKCSSGWPRLKISKQCSKSGVFCSLCAHVCLFLCHLPYVTFCSFVFRRLQLLSPPPPLLALLCFALHSIAQLQEDVSALEDQIETKSRMLDKAASKVASCPVHSRVRVCVCVCVCRCCFVCFVSMNSCLTHTLTSSPSCPPPLAKGPLPGECKQQRGAGAPRASRNHLPPQQPARCRQPAELRLPPAAAGRTRAGTRPRHHCA